jgi:threonyl-tRNA synthetase
MTDSIGRAWQMGTIQLDAMMPERLDATYTTADDRQERPFMIHRALFGSFERFIGILIEHFAGAFPLWLAPVQAVVLPISDTQNAYALEVCDRLLEAGLRATVDQRDEKVGRKIRDAEEQKVPAMLVVGEREAEAREVSLRRHGRRNLGARPLGTVLAALATENAERWLDDREPADEEPLL